jgi:hypothetical protein
VALMAGDVRRAAVELRDLPDDGLDDVPPRFLRASAALLRIGAYSAWVAARRMDRLAGEREHAEAVRRAGLIADEATR